MYEKSSEFIETWEAADMDPCEACLILLCCNDSMLWDLLRTSRGFSGVASDAADSDFRTKISAIRNCNLQEKLKTLDYYCFDQNRCNLHAIAI